LSEASKAIVRVSEARFEPMYELPTYGRNRRKSLHPAHGQR